MSNARSIRHAAHNAYLAAQRGVAVGTHTFADVDAARAAFHAACDAEHAEAESLARSERRAALDARAIAHAVAVRSRILRWGC